MGDKKDAAIERYVGGIAGVAVVAIASAVFLLARDTAIGGPLALAPIDILIGVGIAIGLGVLHRFPFTFHWREHRLVISLDEAGILIALLLTPAPMVTLAVVYATTFMQWWSGPAQRIKKVFNIVQYASAAALSTSLFLILTLLGVPNILAAALSSLAFGTTANLLLAGVFARLSGESTLRVYRERFLAQGLNSSLISIAGGLTLISLWNLHPLATLSIVPFAFLVRGYWRLNAAADRELGVHRQLANAVHDLVGTKSVPAVAERLVSECEHLLDAGRVELTIQMGTAHSLGRNFGSGPQNKSEPIRQTLPQRAGGALGEIAAWPRQGKEPFGDQERALLRTIAGQAASALENARAIEEADSARGRLDTYLSTAQDAVLLVDPEGMIRYLNPAATRLLGVEGQDRRFAATDFFEDPRLLTAPETAQLVEAEGHTIDYLRTFLVEAHLGPVHELGRRTGTLMVVRDVSERKQLEDEMRRQREALAQSEKLSTLGTLVAGVAHEINNPLTFMRGNLQLTRDAVKTRLQRDDLTDAERSFANDIAEEVQVALEGVDRIREISTSLKNVAKRGTVDRKAEDLNLVVHEVFQVVRTGVPRNVNLELDLAEALPAVMARASEMHQVLLNLLKNAVEALGEREESLVRVRSWSENGRVFVQVSDNGPGIPPDVQKNMFQTFFTTKPQGTGLGLSISRGIAQSHGGELSLASEVGVGTSFTLELPAAAEGMVARARDD